MSSEKLRGQDTYTTDATAAVRAAQKSAVKAQGGTNLASQPVNRPEGDMSDLTGGGRENTNSMGDGREDWRTRDDQPGYYDYMGD